MGKDKRKNIPPRHRRILAALNELGGEATTREIAKKAGMNVNGVSQSLGNSTSFDGKVEYLGDKKWKVIK